MSIEIIYYLALVIGLYMAWNIGANDVANSVGTSVGSKAITLRQAVLIAAIFEFSGAFLVGGGVTDTVRKGILDTSVFIDGGAGMQYYFVLAMFAALASSAIWLNIATYFGWPVSTTHSIVGGIVGAGLVVAGFNTIHWGAVAFISASWVLSPVIGALVGGLIYFAIKKLLIDTEDREAATKKWAPVMLMPIFTILMMMLFTKGLKKVPEVKALGPLIQLGLSLVSGLVMSLAAAIPMKKFIDHKIKKDSTFDPVEGIFRYLQVVTACFVAFAHGSNDVANAIGPMAAIRDFYINGTLSTEGSAVPLWMLGIGGIGIVVGLATYGYKVIATVGSRLTELVPTRGFAAEFGAAVTILAGSYLGLPLSTTHTLVGAVIGVGLMRGREYIDFGTLKMIFASWILTLPVAALLSAILVWGLLQF